MMYVLWGAVFLFQIFCLIRMRRMMRDGKEALKATEAMCDASKEFFDWLEQNSWSIHANAEFQERVRKIIRAEKKFLDTHPSVDMEPSIVRWNELIDENR